MSYNLKLKEEALEDLSKAYRFYEEEMEGLGEDFLSIIESVFSKIREHPHRYPEKYQNKRIFVVKKYPFVVIYEVEVKTITVYSVFHTSRNPQIWEKRK
ncbi:type II toxin-antitoxin system RelE/ParE family toxin [Cytophagaceae bacterium ABcell3]|nr:type II toxin-antitoxin system RelE/ParE family toxin [Cytophagaceae bacterium ABcell3]